MSNWKPSGKSFDISKQEVMDAWKQVKEKKGAPGVDGVTIDDFEADLKDNLYKIWNRMSSGSYMAQPVRAVEVPKPHGDGTRVLGIPTVAERVAQTVVANRLVEKVEPIFHPDSFGYRPKRKAHDAIEICRKRCWKYPWVLEFDIRKFFDSVDRELIVKAVEANCPVRWVILYVKRWLHVPVVQPDGSTIERDRGMPQGSPISPALANLFLHYAFDRWMAKNHSNVPFERYADDAVIHCVSRDQAEKLVKNLESRLTEVGLQLHPDKTRIVYCKDQNRKLDHEHTSFTFLGFTFRARAAKTRDGKLFTSFLPAVSKAAINKMSRELYDKAIHHRTGCTLEQLAKEINPFVRGKMQYYGAFYRSEMHSYLQRVNAYLMRWLRKKFRRLHTVKKAEAAWERIVAQQPKLFAQWAWTSAWWQG